MRRLIIIISSLILWIPNGTINKIKNNGMHELYIIYGLCLLFLTGFLAFSERLLFVRILIATIYIIFMGYVYIYIAKKSNFELDEKYKQLMKWSFALFYYLLFISILLIEFSKVISWLNLIVFFISFYYLLQYIIYKWINHWFKYSMFFLISPLIVVIFWSFVGMLLMERTNNAFFISNELLVWVTLILSIIVMNLIIIFSPYERIHELKVAVYFSLAVISTISYSFFLSDISTNLVLKYSSLDKKIIKEIIETLIKWSSLPYLIGLVFGCFTLELKQRNYQLKLQNKHLDVS